MKHKIMVKLRNLLQSNNENLLKGVDICWFESNGDSLIFPVQYLSHSKKLKKRENIIRSNIFRYSPYFRQSDVHSSQGGY